MIKFYDGAIPETVIGCRIQTLSRCYGDMQNAVDLYTDGKAVICRFEDTLLATEGCSLDELLPFADVLGIKMIEFEAQSDADFSADGWIAECHPVLYRDCVGTEEIAFLPSLKECFEVICAADEQFAADASYLHWLSDMTRRQNRGSAKAYCQGAAAAVISAVGDQAAYLSSVAVLPQSRKEGRASALINRVCSDKMLSGKRLFTAAQTDAVAGLYLKNGFSPLEKSVITLKRSSF